MAGIIPVIAFLLVASCCFAENHGPCKRDSRIRGLQDWFATTPAAFGGKYKIPKLRREKILERYKTLKLGMSESEVEALLGLPDFEQLYSTYDSYIGNRPVANPHCGWEWEYYFAKAGDNFADPSDSLLHLAFNSQGKLIWAKPQNISGIEEKGFPEQ